RVFVAAVEDGVFRREGGAWARAADGLEQALPIAVVATGGKGSTALYAGTAAGVFRAATAGGAWSEARAGQDGWRVLSLAIDPGSAERAFVVVEARDFGTM